MTQPQGGARVCKIAFTKAFEKLLITLTAYTKHVYLLSSFEAQSPHISLLSVPAGHHPDHHLLRC